MKILIVEDEVNVAKLLAESVNLQGHEAVVAYTAREAIDLVDRERPQAIFLDLVIPGTGIAVLRWLRTRASPPPVVVVTGHVSDADVAEARELGVLDVLEKPFVLRYLDETLRRLGGEPGEH